MSVLNPRELLPCKGRKYLRVRFRRLLRDMADKPRILFPEGATWNLRIVARYMLLISVLETQRQADLRVQGLVYVESSVWNRTGEMASQFRALVPEEVLGSIPSIHVVAHSNSPFGFQGTWFPLLTFINTRYAHGTHVCRKNIHTLHRRLKNIRRGAKREIA